MFSEPAMSKPIVIFGTGDIAEVAHFYFTHDALRARRVVAFTVHAQYVKEATFCGLPVVAFEDIERRFAPGDVELFVATSYAGLNKVRQSMVAQCQSKGYALASYLSSKATVWDGFVLGTNCFILEDNTLQPFVRIGNNVTLWSGNHIGHHSMIDDHCFIASHVVVSGGVKIGTHCFIGVNATIRDHVSIGESCVIGAGALIAADAADFGVYAGAATERSRVPSNRLRNL